MSRGPCTFRQRDVTAAVKAAQAAGMQVAGVEIGKDGTIRIVTGTVKDMPTESGKSEWEGSTL
jgi:hypothetical protein